MSRKRISADKAVQEILDWVDRRDDLEDDDILELNGDAANNEEEEPNNNEEEESNNNEDDGPSNHEEDDNEENEEQQQSRQFYQKVHTYMRDVHSIDSSLDEENYDVFEVPAVEKILHGRIHGANERRNRVEITLVNQKPFIPGRQRAADVMLTKPGVSRHTRNVKTPLDSFEFFFTDKLFETITDLTNIRIEETLARTIIPECSRNKYSWLKVCTVIEMRAFIGLMYYRGLYGLNMMSTNVIFSERHGPPVFSATMGKNRFGFILYHLCFDDRETREERRKHDRFAAFRDVFEEVNEKFGKALIPEDYLSLDETLYPSRQRISFRQYNPDKPSKYGI